MSNKSSFRWLVVIYAVGVLTIAGAGCEVPAATGTVEVTLEAISARDIDEAGRILFAVASVNTNACQEGPCSPDPCVNDAAAIAQGRTYCIGLGDQHRCVCPPGFYEDMSTGTGVCVVETECLPRACAGDYGAGWPVRGGLSAMNCMPGAIACTCAAGYIGQFCEECDVENGYVRNGNNFCSLPDPNTEVCRDGQGIEDFAAFIADAEAKAGRGVVELELDAARMEFVAGTEQGVRSWDYIFSGPITLFLQTVSGFPTDAGVADVPPTESGLQPIDFDVRVTRATTSSNEQFKTGDFRVGISAPTDRQVSEMFGGDIKLILDFNAY